MSTPKGRQYSLLLGDGSKVWLNAASSIKFPTAFTGSTRVVEITGEAYFEVAHDAAKPFIVSVNDMQVEVLGTHFNINSYSDEPEIKTTLLEGKVRVTRGGSIGILKPGQQASVNSANELKIEDADVDAVMAWKTGVFDFRSLELPEIMRQIARWYDLDVKYEGEPGHEKFSGIVSRKSNVSQVLKIMESAGVKFRINNKEITVLK
jgi:ferric-dicitrate binding protein FerR (iron transport regulator)